MFPYICILYFLIFVLLILFPGQRITTIQLDGTQYYISRMNPYSAELNYFLAYEYCRSIGLQLASFETLEKTNSISDFLRNAGKIGYFSKNNFQKHPNSGWALLPK